MKNFLQTIWRQIQDFWMKLTQSQKIRLGVLAALLVLVIIVASVILGRVEYAALYSNMPDAEAAEVYAALEGMNVKVRSAKAGDNKTTLSVPSDQVEPLRMQLAGQGYPKPGSSTAIYQQASGLTSTTQTQNTMKNFQDEENLRTTIIAYEGIAGARVHLNIKQTSAFVIDRSTNRSTASVFLELEPGAVLNNEGVRAIAHLVSHACSDMAPEDVNITDSSGRLYVYSLEDDEEPVDPGDKYAREAEFERSLEARLMDYFYPIFGEKVTVQVKATMNDDKHSVEQTVFSPPVAEAGNDGLPISYRELYESINGEGEAAGGATGLDENGGAPTYPYDTESEANGPYSRVEREYNNAVNEVKTLIEKAPGYIEDLTVALSYDLPDSFPEDYALDAKIIQNTVMNATGIADKKKVTVSRIPMVGIPTTVASADPVSSGLSGSDINQLIKMGMIAIALIIVVALLAKLLRDITKPKEIPVFETELVAETGAPLYDLMVGEPEEAMMIPEFEFGTKNINRERIEKLIEKDPESVAQLLRSWLTEE